MRRNVLSSLLLLLLIPALLSAYTIVLKNGQRIEAQGRYVVEGNMAKFTDSNGRPRQVPVGEIDVVATERANAAAATTIPVPRADEGKRGPKVWTNDEIERLVRGDRTLVVGTAAPASPSAATEEAAPAAEEAAAAPAEEAPQKPKEQTPEYWQERMKPLREEMAKVDQQLQQLRSGQGQAASNAINVNANAPGVDVRDTIQRLEQKRADLQRQFEDLQTEARRAGVPPGWVR
ncbi:MAG TPA: hypothetical protein VLB32_01830 [Candidatus Acidoferrales bacterium]|nr:hypothetical protein [Candidatus Acidoferrales bacterium]